MTLATQSAAEALESLLEGPIRKAVESLQAEAADGSIELHFCKGKLKKIKRVYNDDVSTAS